MTDKEKLDKALELLSDMVEQADQDCPGDNRTRHFRDTMSDCVDFLIQEGTWEQ
jgi:hypothetical protein